MKFIKNFILILLFIFPISNSFGAMVTEVDSDQEYSFVDGSVGALNGIAFNPDGTKMFLSHQSSDQFISEYNLSTPFDIVDVFGCLPYLSHISWLFMIT
jgi:hypothetical protein